MTTDKIIVAEQSTSQKRSFTENGTTLSRETGQVKYGQALTRLLREAGQRVTRFRVALLKTLLAARQPLSHPEVQQRLEENYSTHIDCVTLYRNLESLVDVGLAHRITADDRVWRFSARRHQQTSHHPHFHCVSCGQMFCLLESQVTTLLLPQDYSVIEMELVVNEVCARCGQQHSKSAKMPY